ncbi:MAG: sigma-70 family RNA polymerase sigma factor [Paludibacteraceae bacterium]|nr:sigma-70 family RNA polymerase sigma factor [Paludibacteraceae bacterium]
MILTIFTGYKSLSDVQLMELIRRRDDNKAFAELYRRYARLLQGFFFRRLGGNTEQASDLTQDTFMRLWSSRLQYSSGQPLRTWIFTIAYNLCKNIYRRNLHEQEYLDTLATDEPSAEDNTPLLLDAAAFDKALQYLLSRLNESQQMLFELRFTQELTIPEIAAILDIPEGTVKSRLYTLTNHLRLRLKAYEN